MRFLYDFHRTCVERSTFWPVERMRMRSNPFFGMGDFPAAASIAGARRLALETLLRPKPDTRVTGFKEIRWWRHDDLDAYVAWLRQVFPGARFLVNTRYARGRAEVASGGPRAATSPTTSPTSSGGCWRPPTASATRRTESTSTTTSRDPSTLAPMFAWLGEEYDEESVRATMAKQALRLTRRVAGERDFPGRPVNLRTQRPGSAPARRPREQIRVTRCRRERRFPGLRVGHAGRDGRRGTSLAPGPPPSAGVAAGPLASGLTRGRHQIARRRGPRPRTRPAQTHAPERSARATSLRCWVRLRWTAPTNSPARPVPSSSRSGIPTNRPAPSRTVGLHSSVRGAAEPFPDEAQPAPPAARARARRPTPVPRARRSRPTRRRGSRAYAAIRRDRGQLSSGRHVHGDHPVLQRVRPAHLVEQCPFRGHAAHAVPDHHLVLVHRARFTRTPGRDRIRSLPAASTTGSRVVPVAAPSRRSTRHRAVAGPPTR